VQQIRETLNGRYDDLKSGKVKRMPYHVTILTEMAHTDDQIDGKASELAVQRAREAMSDPSNTSEERDELEASLKRSMAEIEFNPRRRGSRPKG
jgi:F0F1-type ATP synthase epsilon subunit